MTAGRTDLRMHSDTVSTQVGGAAVLCSAVAADVLSLGSIQLLLPFLRVIGAHDLHLQLL
jgi:hypothetical protein